MIQLKVFFAHNSERNYSYLIQNHDRVWIIDPFDPGPLIDYIKKNSLKLQGIINTHQHWDHIRGNAELLAQCNGSLFSLNDEDKVVIDDENFLLAINSPGHTVEHQVFAWYQRGEVKAVFSGDTIFNGGVGNCKNGGSPEVLFETIKKLMKLPANVVIYPGHDYARKNLLFAQSIEPDNPAIEEYLLKLDHAQSEKGLEWTLGDEIKFNPFFRLESKKIRQKLNLTQIDDSQSIERDVFLGLRKLRDKW